MKLHTALKYLIAVLLVAPGCADQNGTPQPLPKTGGQSGSGSGGNTSGGRGGNASGGSGGTASGGSGGTIPGGSGGMASGGSGGNASGGSSGSFSGGSSASGGNPGSGGSAGAGSGGSSKGGSAGANPDSAVGSGGMTGPDGGKDGPSASGGKLGSGGSSATGGDTGSGGGIGTGGLPGSGGAGGPTICKFSSGLNVAWVNFASDVPSPNITTFSKIFKDTYDNGGRVVRWWFHVNGTTTPGYNSDGTVKKIPQSHIDDVKKILAAANAVGIGVNISLWSFDMGQDNAGNAATQNQALLTTDSLRQSYIDNYLTDLVKGLKGTPGLYSYEIFNEPEGMSTTGWATKFKIDEKYIQMCVNWWAAAIHAADPTVPVTNGSQTMQYKDKYTDSALVAAGGKATGILDFYEVHYYQVNGASNNVFANARSHWNMPEKKLVIGEFAAYSTDTSPVAANDSYTYLFTNGYDGAWGWSYTEGNSNYAWPSMKTPMQNLYTAQKATIDACP